MSSELSLRLEPEIWVLGVLEKVCKVEALFADSERMLNVFKSREAVVNSKEKKRCRALVHNADRRCKPIVCN